MITFVTILASYSEIALKGKYVRRRLERKLGNDIKKMVIAAGYPEPDITLKFGRIYVDGVPNEAATQVSKTFGVVWAMPAKRTTASFEVVIDQVVEEARKKMNRGDSFAIRPKVVGDHPFGSRDLAVEAGSSVLDALKERDIHVDLDNPDHTFYIEVRDQEAFIYTEMVSGVMGLPYGTQGSMVSLFSGGIDSPVSTWLLMKRGVRVLPLFMDQTPYISESYINRAVKSFEAIADYVPEEFHLYSAPMGDIMERILETENRRYSCILCKRSMYHIAYLFAKSEKAKGIITGESLGQVASQTLDNLFVLDRSVEIPVIRPIIGLDKVEIEKIAREIGTYDITAKSVDGCTVVPENPATRSNIEVITEIEEKLNLIELCQEASENIRIIQSI
jgi:thiamine biosynthesis protein ThiI